MPESDFVALDLDSAESHAQAAVELAEELDVPVALSDALQTLAKVYSHAGMLSEQLEVSTGGWPSATIHV